jgi:hypothetical protein
MTAEEAKRIVLEKVGVAELPDRIQADWDGLPMLCDLHGESALDDVASMIRREMAAGPA